MSGLSERQRAFCRYLVAGLSQEQAYVKAGYAQRGARAHAARLVAFGSISSEVERLRKAAEDALVMSRKERMQLLSDVARKYVEGGDARVGISAIQELNRMDGAYKPEEKKVEVCGVLGVSAVLDALAGVEFSLCNNNNNKEDE